MNQPETHQEELEILNKLGFLVNPYNQKTNSLKDIWNIKLALSKEKNSLNYPIDGLVIKINDNKLNKKLGYIGKTPRSWCAVKFESTEVSTKIKKVIWQIGRTGKITPVADLLAVKLAGTTVQRATLHNYKEFLEKNLYENDTLIIRKAGEIIPEVVKVLVNLRISKSQKLNFPRNCTSCHSTLIVSDTGVDLFCPNIQNCPDQILLRLSYFCKRNIANITGLSEKTLKKIIQKFEIKDIYDIYKIDLQKISEMEGFGKKSIENLEKSIENSKILKDYKFLTGLSLEGIGLEVAKLICEKLQQKLDK
jgi:DNA ligase (NAD+)